MYTDLPNKRLTFKIAIRIMNSSSWDLEKFFCLRVKTVFFYMYACCSLYNLYFRTFYKPSTCSLELLAPSIHYFKAFRKSIIFFIYILLLHLCFQHCAFLISVVVHIIVKKKLCDC